MFRNLPLSTKLLLTVVPLFLILVVNTYVLTSNGQADAMIEQAKTSVFEKASIARLALVQEMLEKQKVSDAFLKSLQSVGGLEDLYIRIHQDKLHLKDWLDDDSTRGPRLSEREQYARSKGPIGEDVFTTGTPLFVTRENDFEAIIPFKAEKRCQTCHDVPINQVLGVAHVTVPMTAIKASIAANSQRTALITFGFGLITILVGSLLYRQVIRKPIQNLVSVTEAIAQGNLNFEVPRIGAKDELGNLSRSFDSMRKSLRTAQDALRTSMVGQIASSLIRDFRAPMRQILTVVDQVEKGTLDEANRGPLSAAARNSVIDMNKMAQDLLDYTTGDMKAQKRSASVSGLLNYVADNVRPDLERDMLTLNVQNGVQANAAFDYERLARAINNIISYSVNYIPPGGVITLSSQAEGKGFKVVVADNGNGIPPQFRDRIFEPFTKIVQEKGLGLSMALAKRIIEMQGGTVKVESEEGKGTKFTIVMGG